ncbi:MAG: hypothetical protein KDC82_00580, partial [Bacteroidetes bacterium]|nr:hypothetical protein [Bacteroidota bacterium]
VRKKSQEERKRTSRAVKKTQSSVEKSTLGDLAAFSELKEQLQDQEEEGGENTEEKEGEEKE